MTDELVDWVERERQKQGWSIRDLARRASLGHATVGHVLNRYRQPGRRFCQGMARAFKVPTEFVYRLAGFLPPEPENDEQLNLALWLFNRLSPDERQRMLKWMRMLADEQDEGE